MGDAKRRIESGLMVLAKPPTESKIMVIENIKDGVTEITQLAEGMRDRHSRGFILIAVNGDRLHIQRVEKRDPLYHQLLADLPIASEDKRSLIQQIIRYNIITECCLFFTLRSVGSKAVQTETATTRIDEIAQVLGATN
jgi:hypothetical protein